MKKILRNNFSLLMFIFLILYTVLLRYNANDSVVFYSIGLMIGAVFTGIVPIFLNHCKKIEVRRCYIATFISISITLILFAISYLFRDNYIVYVWILRFSIAASISTLLLQLYYTIKDWFKKGYTFEKFDLQAIKMLINSITYFMIFYTLVFVGEPAIRVAISFTLEFYVFDFSIVAHWFLYISLAYLVCHAIIEVIYYNLFTKNEPRD